MQSLQLFEPPGKNQMSEIDVSYLFPMAADNGQMWLKVKIAWSWATFNFVHPLTGSG